MKTYMTILPEIYGLVGRDSDGACHLYYDIQYRYFMDCNGDMVGCPEDVMPDWLWFLFRSAGVDESYEFDGMVFVYHYPEDVYWPGHYAT